MKVRDSSTGDFKTVFIKGRDNFPIGTIVAFSSNTVPYGWLLCDGSKFDSTEYSELYEVLGSNTLPDLKGLFLVGAGTGTDVHGNQFTFNLRNKDGEYKHLLTIDEMPSHDHLERISRAGDPAAVDTMGSAWGNGETVTYLSTGGVRTTNGWKMATAPTGGGQYHNNIPPSYGVNYIIKAKNVGLNSVSSIVGSLSSSTTDSYSCNYINNLVKPIDVAYTINSNIVRNIASIYIVGNLIYASIITNIGWTGTFAAGVTLTNYKATKDVYAPISAYGGKVAGEVQIGKGDDYMQFTISVAENVGKAFIVVPVEPK